MIDKNTQAILLLSCYFSKAKKDEPSPLTPSEYARYSRWLFENKYMPDSLLDNFEGTNREWKDPKRKITSDRLKFLLGRGLAMSLALEKIVEDISVFRKELSSLIEDFTNEVGKMPAMWSGPGMRTHTIINDITKIGKKINKKRTSCIFHIKRR